MSMFKKFSIAFLTILMFVSFSSELSAKGHRHCYRPARSQVAAGVGLGLGLGLIGAAAIASTRPTYNQVTVVQPQPVYGYVPAPMPAPGYYVYPQQVVVQQPAYVVQQVQPTYSTGFSFGFYR